jgi:hypothetical protein
MTYRVHKPVLDRGAPIVHVVHRRGGEWLFAAAGFRSASPRQFVTATPAAIVAAHPEAVPLLDLPPGWQAYRQDEDDAWIRRRLPVGRTYLITCEVRPLRFPHPSPDQGSDDDVAGAFVNSWVKSRSLSSARRRARTAIRRADWVIVDYISQQSIRTKATLTKASRRYFDQAQLDGEVHVYHTYPRSAPDAYDA